MNFLHRVVQYPLDFLFPKSRSVVELESLNSWELTQTLPPAPHIDLADTIALFDYHHPLARQMIWELKYGGNKAMAQKLGEMIYDTLQDELTERVFFENWGPPLLVPVPISDKRRFERGWNQAELLAKVVMRYDREGMFKYTPHQLVKVVHTESQTKTASKNERLKNLQNTMRVLDTGVFKGASVVLIDDVLTTGATFKEAKRALKEAGVRKVLCVAVAH